MMKLFRRWGDAALLKRVADLEQRLDTATRQLLVIEAERDTLAAVVVRERARVEAETAIHNRRKAEAEGNTSELRDQTSLRTFSE
jgi:hypothetical protein